MLYIGWVVSIIVLGICTMFKINPKHYILALVSCMAIFAYMFDPILAWEDTGGSGMDGVRYYDMVDTFRTWGWNDTTYVGVPLSRALLYFYSLFPNNHFMQAINYVIYMSACLSIVYKIGKKIGADNSSIVTSMFFCFVFTEYLSIINAIRYPIAIGLVIIILYIDVIKSKWWGKFLYGIPVLMHPGSIMLIVIRFLAKWHVRYTCVFVSILLLVIDIIGIDLFDLMTRAVSFISPEAVVIIGVANKVSSYSSHIVYDVGLAIRVKFFIICIMMLLESVYVKKIMDRKNLLVEFVNMGALVPFIAMLLFFLIDDSNAAVRLAGSGFSAFYFSIMYLYLMQMSKSNNRVNNFNIKFLYWNIAIGWFFIHALKIDYGYLYPAFPW